MNEQDSPKRIAFVLSALTGEELSAGARDVARVHSLLTDPRFGMCTTDAPAPIVGCASVSEFWSQFLPLLKEWRANDQLIFYFSGHGSVRTSYCLEIGSDLLPFDVLLAYLAPFRVHRAIFIIDACHSGAAIKGVKGVDSVLSKMSPEVFPSGVAIIASSRLTQTSHELPDGSASVFTHLLCEGIESGLDGKATTDGLIGVDDIVGYIRTKLTSDERYLAFYQSPVFQVNEADREIWIAKNQSGSISITHQAQSQTLEWITSDFDLEKYRKALSEYYGNLRLETIDATGVYYEMKLSKLFVSQDVREFSKYIPQLYELPKDVQGELETAGLIEHKFLSDELEHAYQEYTKKPKHRVLEVIKEWNDVSRLVFLGDPGCGKSALVHYLALDWTENILEDLSLEPLPLILEMRTYVRNRNLGLCQNIFEFCCKPGTGFVYPINPGYLHRLLREGRAFLMFDGLDEVFDAAQREDISTEIIRLANEFESTRMLITSRVLGYKGQRLRDVGFRHFLLEELDARQIEEFIRRWHDLAYDDCVDRERKRERLEKAISDSRAIRELAGNPLLLTMMAILNRYQELPRERADLYSQASQVLLHHWDIEGKLISDPRLSPVTINHRDKQSMLRQVAFHMQTSVSGKGNIISRQDLERILVNWLDHKRINDSHTVARLVIEQLRTRNFVLSSLGADYYAFVHRTFLEYFCALELVSRFRETHTLSMEQLKEVYQKYWRNENWREILHLVVGMIDAKPAKQILEFILEQ